MRIVTYKGLAVKRQKKVGRDEIKVVFYDEPPIIVTGQEWLQNSRNQYFDDPKAKRCDVVRRPAAVR